ncbi:phytoene dehydrogenase-like protein [Amycolatopsis jiangsuensis]|uniref:Phytoene dehydrogenase-like protein n=1 Tax=Amycolatopsis jiangsuensis TaxID=1181879 RepID=A0A840IUX5_9PSEU|nr:phytoene dehydrogenase-like protein [Amycolatopsis jiangsuensis]
MDYDAVIVGGGHNGLVAAGYLARAGRSVLVLERRAEIGGAAVSFRAFGGVDVRLSRYSYLVSLLPRRIVADLGLNVRFQRRRMSSCTPVGDAGLLVDTADEARTAESFRTVTGSTKDFDAWRRFYALAGRVAAVTFDSLTEALPSRAELRARLGDDEPWETFFERPVGETLTTSFTDDTVRGVVLTDARTEWSEWWSAGTSWPTSRHARSRVCSARSPSRHPKVRS